jgi:outer membrane immunogenic protein
MLKLVSGVAAFALSIGGALAADLPVYEAPPAPPPPAFTWTGFYIGAQGGWAWGQAEVDIGAPDDDEFDVDGWMVGGFAGYNYQFASPLVVGIEADIEAAGIDGNDDDPVFGSADTEVRVQGSIRSRVGYAFDRLLPYITAGFAAARPDVDTTAAGESDDDLEWGWTAGAGLEFAATDHLFVRGEYRFTDLGDFDNQDDNGDLQDLRTHSVRVGAGWKF